MSEQKYLVVDANILLSAVFGQRVRNLIKKYGDSAVICTPEICLAEAERNVASISLKRKVEMAPVLEGLQELSLGLEVVDKESYGTYEAAARARIGHRDMDDWPVVATALLLDCPIWTEDHDFFGCGVATWTSQTVELYLGNA